MNKMSCLRAVLAGLAAMATGACYTQSPISEFPPPTSTRIVAQVTDSGVVAMANAIGPAAQEVEGVVEGFRNDTLRIQMLRVDHRGGSSVSWAREVVSFPRYALIRTTQNKLDKRKSWMAAGGILIGAFAASRLFSAIGADEPPDDGTNPPATLMVPFRMRR